MVRTMSLIRALISTARMVRHTPRLAEGLPPDDAVLLDAPDDRLAPALVSAALGEYEHAAKLLATTRESAEWEDRDRYVMRLAAFAHNRDEWLARWLAASPADPDALVVRAELGVRKAWESPARAELLRETGPLIGAAAEGDPRDPVPWRIALDHARGTRAGHRDFESLWGEAVRRSSHHYGCHVAALQYLSGQWHGSHQECFDFAEQAAADALPGSLVKALPMRAAFSRLLSDDLTSVTTDRIDAACDEAILLSSVYVVGDPWPAEVRNLLAYVLVRRHRWDEALEQFRLIGPYATSFPWTSLTDDPLGQFLETRDGVRLQVASGMPLWNRTDRGRPRGHYA
ncbi:hypothetical protein GCM10011583_29240 [Streptomyces camponoticapitis]|uniref:DUF4034 domain-containing protein n=1 Tax=Streptomyces camponoticapitis TaxID=1616125 RepID=A0ABQ2E651_9ACTN|nr:hypothetical protein [Streptomyces camponoticapitis]GGJ95783.1 hypothetical protein GCM10011583_29240 [Streptomyces camponoticapitis]